MGSAPTADQRFPADPVPGYGFPANYKAILEKATKDPYRKRGAEMSARMQPCSERFEQPSAGARRADRRARMARYLTTSDRMSPAQYAQVIAGFSGFQKFLVCQAVAQVLT